MVLHYSRDGPVPRVHFATVNEAISPETCDTLLMCVAKDSYTRPLLFASFFSLRKMFRAENIRARTLSCALWARRMPGLLLLTVQILLGSKDAMHYRDAIDIYMREAYGIIIKIWMIEYIMLASSVVRRTSLNKHTIFRATIYSIISTFNIQHTLPSFTQCCLEQIPLPSTRNSIEKYVATLSPTCRSEVESQPSTPLYSRIDFVSPHHPHV